MLELATNRPPTDPITLLSIRVSLLKRKANRVDTKVKEVEDAFVGLSKRSDIGIIIINQCVGDVARSDRIDCRYDPPHS